MIRVEGQLDRLARRKDDLARENAVLRRENDRLRGLLAETSSERDTLSKRIKHSTRHVETALTRLNLLSEDD